MKPFHVIILNLSCLVLVLASYEDARCKCVCVDRHGSYNGTKPTGKIFVKAIAADQCNCKLMLGSESALCPYCDCKYQVRNTTTIKVVVCLILVVISALTLYMVFLLLLEPLLSARRAGYKATTLRDLPVAVPDTVTNAKPLQEQRNWLNRLDDSSSWAEPIDEQPSETTSTRHRVPCVALAGPSTSTAGIQSAVGVSTVVKSVRDQQQRWKGNVEAQRARVFSEHTLLN